MALNRQPGPMNKNALQMLRERELKKGADVVSADGVFLGKAHRLYHRPDEIDPDLKLYATYLGTSNLKMGSQIYVPVDFIADYDSQNALVTLSVTKSAAMNETWDREPAFIAGHRGTEEELPV
jgi:hypothetical protein